MRRWFVIIASAVVGCFNPTFDHPSCGPNGECPPGTQCVAGTCSSITSGDDAAVDAAIDAYVPDASACIAQVDECITGTDLLRRCDGAGAQSYDVTCNWGCMTTSTPHCAQIVPSGNGGVPANGVMPADVVATAGLMDITLTGGTLTLDGNSGSISSFRGTGSGILSGIDYQLRGPIAMFRFKSLTVAAGVTVRVTGSHAVAFVADGAITIDGIIDLRGMNDVPGPGGFAGAMSSAQDGMGPGAGQGKAPTPGGGAGHAAHGGMGFQNGGPGGIPYGDSLITQLRGGSGGGSGYQGAKGGGGGGALQLVSNTRVEIHSGGGINAGGQGGSSSLSGEGGGGGAGGALLLEAPMLVIAGALAVNGGGGGTTNSLTVGAPGGLDRNAAPAAGNSGGNGGAGSIPFGRDATGNGGGGGGGIGRIRLSTRSGQSIVDGAAILSPNLTDGSGCTQGTASLQ